MTNSDLCFLLLSLSTFIKTLQSQRRKNDKAKFQLGISRHKSRNMLLALAGVAQWIEYWPINQRVERVDGSIPSQGTCLGCGPGLQWGAHDRQTHIDVSLFLPPFPSV